MSHLSYRFEIISSFCECFLTVDNCPSFSSSNMPEGINYKLGGTSSFSFLSPHHRRNANPTIDFYLNSTGYRGLSLPNFLKISIFPDQMTIDHFCRGTLKSSKRKHKCRGIKKKSKGETRQHGHVLSHSVVSDSWQPHGLQPPGSSVHGIFQAGILEWVTISSSRGSPHPGNQVEGDAKSRTSELKTFNYFTME